MRRSSTVPGCRSAQPPTRSRRRWRPVWTRRRSPPARSCRPARASSWSCPPRSGRWRRSSSSPSARPSRASRASASCSTPPRWPPWRSSTASLSRTCARPPCRSSRCAAWPCRTPRRAVIFGRGPQAHAHADALAIDDTVLLGRDDPRRDELVAAADVICCCTTAREPLFDGDLVADHACVVAIGSHEPAARETDDRLARRATVVVESRASALREAGDVIAARPGTGRPRHAARAGRRRRDPARAAAVQEHRDGMGGRGRGRRYIGRRWTSVAWSAGRWSAVCACPAPSP